MGLFSSNNNDMIMSKMSFVKKAVEAKTYLKITQMVSRIRFFLITIKYFFVKNSKIY